ncbi:DUF1345 domain-containing protein [Humitalea sp. 24SJ18S-53]|uniref:DUF1345 domain-containing protein n=1 Tax=Humitalea sp. 24SJ18S-53 TaxID=3422307 RepID=UPI003D67BEFC
MLRGSNAFPLVAISASVMLGVALGAGSLPSVHLRGALLMGWCAGAATHAGLLVWRLMRLGPDSPRSDAHQVLQNTWGTIGGAVVAALAALGGVVWEIGGGAPTAAFSLPLGVVTIALSWAFLHVLFAYHYAHAYWSLGGGLAFPGDEPPDGFDFLYFGFTVGVTGAVSDVNNTSRVMRRLVLAQTLTSFAFNAAIVGAAVNVLA